MTKLKKIIIISLGILILLGGLEYWHYRKINAFYFSYQNHESMAKQQSTFFKSIRPKDLKRISILYLMSEPRERPPKTWVSTVYEVKRDHVIFVSIDNSTDNLVINITNKARKKVLLSITVKANSKDKVIDYTDNLYRKDSYKYKKEAMNFYKQTVKKVYDNWEIRYW